MSRAVGSTARIAGIVTCCGIATVLLAFVPDLQAPFLVPKLAALECFGALIFLTSVLGLRRFRPDVLLCIVLVLASTLLSWVVASRYSFGAHNASSALWRWLCVIGFAFGASSAKDDPRARRALVSTVSASAVLVSIIGLWQHLELATLPIPIISLPGSTFGNRNIAAEAIVLALPFALLGFWTNSSPRARVVFVACGVVELLYLAATRARGAWLGAFLAACAILLAIRHASAVGATVVGRHEHVRVSAARLRPARSKGYRARQAFAVIALTMLIIAVAVLPGRFTPEHAGDQKRFASASTFVAGTFDRNSLAVRSRLGMWKRTLRMISDYPVTGVGPGNWPILFPRYAEPGSVREGVLTEARAPRQAHQDFLECAAETGLVGLACRLALFWTLLVAVVRALRAGREREPDVHKQRTLICGGSVIVAVMAMGLLGFPMQMPGTLALLGIAIGLIAPATDPPPATSMRSGLPLQLVRVAWLALALAACLHAGLRASREIRASALLSEAERALNVRGRRPVGAVPVAPSTLVLLERARALLPDSFRAHMRLAQAQLASEQFENAERTIQGALRLEPYSPNAWAALALAQLNQGELDAADASTRRALVLLHDFPSAEAIRAEVLRRRRSR